MRRFTSFIVLYKDWVKLIRRLAPTQHQSNDFRMDPTGYAEKGLPQIEHDTVISRRTYCRKKGDDSEYYEMLKVFKSYLEADCHAMVVDNEILFNYYELDSIKSMKNFLLDLTLRNALSEEPHTLMVQLLNRKKDATVTLYMFGNTPMFVVTRFHTLCKEIEMVIYASKKYTEEFGTKEKS